MTTNINALPLVHMTIETGNNEDWVESWKYVIDDGTEDPPQVDLTGIRFVMEVRRRAEDHEVILTASTDDHKLKIGAYPDSGYLLLFIDNSEMAQRRADAYVGDIVANDDFYTRTIIQFNLTIFEGVTK